MLDVSVIHHTELEPREIEGVDLNVALKNYVLFTELDEAPTIALSEQYITQSFDFISKYNFEHPVVFLDEESYEKLYNRFLEIRTDREITDISDSRRGRGGGPLLTEFLRNSADILTSEESAPIIKFVNCSSTRRSKSAPVTSTSRCTNSKAKSGSASTASWSAMSNSTLTS